MITIPEKLTYNFVRSTRNGFLFECLREDGSPADLSKYFISCTVKRKFKGSVFEFDPYVDGNIVSYTFSRKQSEELFDRNGYYIQVHFRTGGDDDYYFVLELKMK
jgi:hypothetical protein